MNKVREWELEWGQPENSGRYIPEGTYRPLLFVVKCMLDLECSTCLEIGISRGFTTTLLASHGIKVFAVDISNNAIFEAQEHAKNIGILERIEFFKGDSKEILPDIHQKFDGIYVDGDHTYEGTLFDMKWALEHANKVVLCHDIDGSFPECRNAFLDIVEERKLTYKAIPDRVVTGDGGVTSGMGVVYMEKGRVV